LNRLDKEKTYFVYCSTGYRSGQVIQRMKTLGFKRAFNLSGGITEFRRSGLSANP
jgi:phage shock protein E